MTGWARFFDLTKFERAGFYRLSIKSTGYSKNVQASSRFIVRVDLSFLSFQGLKFLCELRVEQIIENNVIGAINWYLISI